MQNVNADCLSRLPINTDNTHDFEEEEWMIANISDVCHAIKEDEWREAMYADAVMVKVIKSLPTAYGWKLDYDLISYKDVWEELSMVKGVLRRCDKLVVPGPLRSKLMELLHEGHEGMSAVKRKARMDLWWPGMDRDSPITPTKLPERAWERLALDICGPFEGLGVPDTYALVMVDYYSKWPEVGFVVK